MKNNEKKSKKTSNFWAVVPLTLAGMGFCYSLQAQVIKTNIEGKKTFLTYKMQAGETASELIKDYKITLKDLATANPNKDLSKLNYGEIIIIPQENEEIAKNETKEAEQENGLLRGEQNVENAESIIKYKAQKNENIYTIAKKYNTTAANLRILNNMAVGADKITPGQELVVRINSKKNIRKNIENKGINTMQIAKNDKGKNQKNLLGNTTNTNNQGKTRGEENNNNEPEQPNNAKIDTLHIETIENLVHIVGEKETLASIARANNTTQDEILKTSHLDVNYKIKTGDKIVIPSKKITLQITQTDNNETQTEPIPYTVQPKDNLTIIAEKYHVSTKEIKNWNNIPENSDLIKEGQNLKIYPPIVENYIVKKGDTWKNIAQKYGVTEKQILVWNGLLEDDNAVPKQQIEIYKPSMSIKKWNKQSTNHTTNTQKQTEQNTPKTNAKIKYHHIEYGDNFSKIREMYNISSTEIKFWNNRKINDDNLAVGDSLKLYLPIEKQHTVKQGETPKQIAQMYGVNTAQIRIWNKLKPKNENYEFDVNEGQELIIFEPTGTKPTRAFLESKSTEQKEQKNTPTDIQGLKLKKHTVTQGETLYKISKIYDVTTDDIKQWNNLVSPSINEGDILNVYVSPKQENNTANTKNQNTKGNTTKKPDNNAQNNNNTTNGKLGDGNLKVETPNPDADPLHQLNESTITNQKEKDVKNVIGDKNNDNDTNNETKNEEGVQIVHAQGLIQYSQEVRGNERNSVFVREDKKHFASVDIINTQTGNSVTASIAGVITNTLTPSIMMEVTPEIMRALGFDLSDVPSMKLEFKK
jgi:LysM repeat protein